ncbi:unnamed protein product [Rotaria sp. Silwood1]|nr:unnamed protein product [Rotaria sp. Silwood1]
MYRIEEHLAPLPGVVTNSLLDESSSDDDSCVEITSVVDENENELIKWTTYLQLNSNSDDDSDENYSSTQPAPLVNYSSSESSSDNENLLQSSHQSTSSNNNSNVDITSSSTSTIMKKRYAGDRCEIVDNKIILSFSNDKILSSSIFIHFIEVIDNDFPK